MATKKKPTAKKAPPARKAAPAKKPKKAAAPKPGDARAKLDAAGIEWVCSQIAEKTTLTNIAKEAGVSIGTLLTWLEASPERSARAREARTHLAKLYDEQALERIEAAKNTFELAKAREAAHHLRWRASKAAPKEYGDKVQLGQADDLAPLNVTVKNYGAPKR